MLSDHKLRRARQRGMSQAAFRHALEGLRICQPTVEGWQTLPTRVRVSSTPAEVEYSSDAVHIYTLRTL